ncbi:MAG: glutamate racemase [Acidimicrobiales bacterium]
MDDRPIGIFDSGFGGLTVARALADLLPHEEIVYLGDTERFPYGERSLDEVRGYAWEIATTLVASYDVKMVVIACNTASAAALDLLRFGLEVPVVGVIEPGVKAALAAANGRRVGVIGTVATISSRAYERAFAATRSPGELETQACPGFVELVEAGSTAGPSVIEAVRPALAPLVGAGIGALLLGCTHYPFLARSIGAVMGEDVVLVSSAEETAFTVRSILDSTGMSRRAPGKGHTFVSSGDPGAFAQIGAKLFGEELGRVGHLSFRARHRAAKKVEAEAS